MLKIERESIFEKYKGKRVSFYLTSKYKKTTGVIVGYSIDKKFNHQILLVKLDNHKNGRGWSHRNILFDENLIVPDSKNIDRSYTYWLISEEEVRDDRQE